MNGIINFNKPKGMTSHDAVYYFRRSLKIKVGHTGTLDPDATDVPICIGKERGFLNIYWMLIRSILVLGWELKPTPKIVAVKFFIHPPRRLMRTKYISPLISLRVIFYRFHQCTRD